MYLPHRYAYLTTKDELKEEKSAIYPFHVNYSSLKQKRQQVKLPQIEVESTQPIGSESASSEHEEQQGYSDSFESYNSFQEEPISQESDHLQQSTNLKPSQTSPRFLPENHLQYILLSQSQLRKSNEQLVALKQQFRIIASKYKHNLFILHRQRQELSMLRSKKKKAIDPDYDYSLSMQYDRKKEKSQMVEESIRRVRRVMKRQNVRKLKEEVLFDDPDNPSCVMSSSRVLDHRAALSVTLLTKREEVLSKRRQSDRYQAYLSALLKKQEQYKNVMDMYDGMIAKGNNDGLEKRVQFLKQEIKLKKVIASAKELQESMMIGKMKNEISAIETMIGQLEWSTAEQKQRIKELNIKDTQKKVDMFVRKKISSQLIPKAKLQQDFPTKQTPKERIRLAFPIESKTPTTHSIQPTLFRANKPRLRQHTTHQ